MIRPVFLCVSFPLIACSAALAQDKTSLNRGGYGSVMTPEQVVRELGPETGLLPGDQAYEGRPVKSVSVRYRSTGKTVSEDRLKNLLATQPGTNYSPEVVNKDLERLLESGLVGGNTTVAVEPCAPIIRKPGIRMCAFPIFTRRRSAPALWTWSLTSMKARRPISSTSIL